MANIKSPTAVAATKKQVLLAAVKLFITQGFQNTSVKEISLESGVSANTIFYEMRSKEELLAQIVEGVLDGQFSFVREMIRGKTEDPILFYAAETTFQLHLAESSEAIRELYATAYALPSTSNIIQHTITGKLEQIFKDHLPDLETKDFYELEIASGGIMRSFMARPCDMYFTMERKIKRFLETTFLVYRVSDEKIKEAFEFVQQIDYQSMLDKAEEYLLKYLEENMCHEIN